MKDLFVRRVYTKQGISIVVELDFVKKTVTFVDKDGKPKSWKFIHRTPEYLNGWLAIFRAMEYATAKAKEEMDAVTEQEHEEFIKLYMALDENLRLKKGKGEN